METASSANGFDKSLFIEILAKNGTDPSEIAEIEILIPPLHGEHFVSSVCTVNAKLKSGGDQINLFAKKIVDDPQYAKDIIEIQVFDREAAVLTQVLPVIRDFVRRRTQGKGVQYELDMVPKCYFADSHMTVQENLTVQGFTCVDKVKGQDLRYAKACVRAIAKYQAPSYVLLKTESTRAELEAKFPAIKDPWDAEACLRLWGPAYDGMMNNVRLLLERAKDRPELVDYGKRYMAQLGPKCLDFIKLQKVQNWDERFLCLNHGDLWNNNWLFRDQGGEEGPEVRMVDYQMPRIISVTLDVANYIYGSVQPEVRQTSMLEILRCYYDALVSNVEVLDSKVFFGFEEMVSDFKRNMNNAFIIGLVFVIMIRHFEAKQDLDKAQGGFESIFGGSMQEWLDENPEKEALMIGKILGLFQERRQLLGDF